MDASRYRAILLLALTFGAGAMVGVAGDRLDLFPSVASATEPAANESADEGRRPGGRRERGTAIEEFADDLGLTVEQRGEIEGILDHYRSDARELNQAVQPQFSALMESVRTRIESVLSEDQVVQYRAILEERYRNGRDQRRERDPDDQQDEATPEEDGSDN